MKTLSQSLMYLAAVMIIGAIAMAAIEGNMRALECQRRDGVSVWGVCISSDVVIPVEVWR